MILIVFSLFFSSTNISNISFKTQNLNHHYSSNNIFKWPFENHFYISSYFGKRIHPITKKVSYHSGIDIPAPQNTKIYSISNGKVLFTGFLGANGYSIIIAFENYEITYSHVSVNYIVKKNNSIKSMQLIGYVGSKYSSLETPYKDSTGKYLNGLTTGPHLHLSIKKDGIAVNPLDYL